MLNNYLMNKLNVATGHFSCSRDLSHRVRCPRSLRYHPWQVPSASVPGIQRHDWAFMPPWVRQEKGPLTCGGSHTDNRSHLQLLEPVMAACLASVQASPPVVPPPPPQGGCPWLQAKTQHCSPVRDNEISIWASLYKHQMVMIKMKLN